MRSINLLILFGIRRNCLSSGRGQLLCLCVRMVMEQIGVIIILSRTYRILSYILLLKLTPYTEIIEDHQCGFWCNRSCILHSLNTWEEMRIQWSSASAIYRLKKTCDSVRWEVLNNICIEFGICMELVRLIKMCLNETCSRVQVDRHLSDMFPIKNGLKHVATLSPLLFNFALEYAIRRVQVHQDGF